VSEPPRKRLKLGDPFYSKAYIYQEGLVVRESTVHDGRKCMRASCSHCSKVWYTYDTKNYSTTTTYRKHFEKYHPTVCLEAPIMQEIQASTAKKESKEQLKQSSITIFAQTRQYHAAVFTYTRAPMEPFDQKLFIKLLINFIISCNLPIRVCDAPSFRMLLSYCCDDVARVTPQKLLKALIESFDASKEALKRKLQTHIEDGSRLSLTLDIWTAANGSSYQAVTVYWIASQWITHARLLCFTSMPVSHIGHNIFQALRKTIKDFVGRTG